MKTIDVPFIPGLAGMTFEQLLEAMETRASRDYIASVNWPREFPYKPLAVFDVARSEHHLFISYSVKGLDLKAEFTANNDPVWQESCVEFFVKDPAVSAYCNFEFNCIGTCLASKRSNNDDRSFLEQRQIDGIIRHCSAGRTPFGERQGIFGWQLVIGIPFEAFGFTTDTLPKVLMANFYKCGDKTSHPHYLSWSPIENPTPNFHLPQFFGELRFI